MERKILLLDGIAYFIAVSLIWLSYDTNNLSFNFMSVLIPLLLGLVVKYDNNLLKVFQDRKEKRKFRRESKEIEKELRAKFPEHIDYINLKIDSEDEKWAVSKDNWNKEEIIFRAYKKGEIKASSNFSLDVLILGYLAFRLFVIDDIEKEEKIQDMITSIANRDFDLKPKNLDDKPKKEFELFKFYLIVKEKSGLTQETKKEQIYENRLEILRDFCNRALNSSDELHTLKLIQEKENLLVRDIIYKVFSKKIYYNNLQEDIKEKIEGYKESSDLEGNPKRGFLVFSKKTFTYKTGRDEIESWFENIWRLSINEPEFPNSIHLVYPNEYYTTPEEFIEKEIKDLVEKEDLWIENVSQVFVLSLETKKVNSIPKEDEDISSEYFEQNLERIEKLNKGEHREEKAILDSVLVEIPVRQLLASLPVNAFVDDGLSDTKQQMLAGIYPKIKDNCEEEIDDLFDWHKKSNSIELYQIISKLDEDGLLSDEEISELSETIIEKSKRLNEGLNQIQG